MADRYRLVVLVSGSGSNLQAIIDAIDDGRLDADIGAVVANRSGVYALERARRAGINTIELIAEPGEQRADYDARLAGAIEPYQPNIVVLAGWMRLLTAEVLDRFNVINLHPALPGEYPGLHAIERAFADAQAGHRDHTGVMVHFVPDEGVDDGPVIATETVPISANDTLTDLEARVHTVEHRLLVAVLGNLSAPTLQRTTATSEADR